MKKKNKNKDIPLINIYVPNIGESLYIKQIPTDHKGRN